MGQINSLLSRSRGVDDTPAHRTTQTTLFPVRLCRYKWLMNLASTPVVQIKFNHVTAAVCTFTKISDWKFRSLFFSFLAGEKLVLKIKC